MPEFTFRKIWHYVVYEGGLVITGSILHGLCRHGCLPRYFKIPSFLLYGVGAVALLFAESKREELAYEERMAEFEKIRPKLEAQLRMSQSFDEFDRLLQRERRRVEEAKKGKAGKENSKDVQGANSKKGTRESEKETGKKSQKVNRGRRIACAIPELRNIPENDGKGAIKAPPSEEESSNCEDPSLSGGGGDATKTEDRFPASVLGIPSEEQKQTSERSSPIDIICSPRTKERLLKDINTFLKRWIIDYDGKSSEVSHKLECKRKLEAAAQELLSAVNKAVRRKSTGWHAFDDRRSMPEKVEGRTFTMTAERRKAFNDISKLLQKLSSTFAASSLKLLAPQLGPSGSANMQEQSEKDSDKDASEGTEGETSVFITDNLEQEKISEFKNEIRKLVYEAVENFQTESLLLPPSDE